MNARLVQRRVRALRPARCAARVLTRTRWRRRHARTALRARSASMVFFRRARRARSLPHARQTARHASLAPTAPMTKLVRATHARPATIRTPVQLLARSAPRVHVARTVCARCASPVARLQRAQLCVTIASRELFPPASRLLARRATRATTPPRSLRRARSARAGTPARAASSSRA